MLVELIAECRQLWRLRGLVGVLTRREIGARFAGSAGGLLWVWLPPLLTVAAYFLVFDIVFGMRLGAQAPTARVGAYLIVGMLAWMAFADAVQRGMASLLEAGGMLQKNPLPPGLFPARAVLASGLAFAPLLLLLVPLYAGSHRLNWGVIAVPALIVLQVALSFLLAYLLAILAAALRDVVQAVGVLLSLGVFLSPVLFPVDMFPERWRWLLWLNPMTGPILGYQSALLKGAWPSAAVWLSIAAWLAVLAVLLSVALARSRDQLVDWL
ncbi:MAG: ABC transporter permease [Desulfovibrionaceae bacterium]|jgi:lipopolysaccharide transport system permease protein|nr:ABC transporter permease [Desulfovibrionaceae bacterium]